MERTIIIGAGQAALQASVSLRQYGYEGTIVCIGDEPFYPYQRPPLSKAYMKGELQLDRLFLKPENWFSENGVEVQLGKRVASIDRYKKTVSLGDFEEDYDHLILATGSRPRQLRESQSALENVFCLRSIADVDKIRKALERANTIAIIGAGYIGLEAAAVARQMHKRVTVIEIAPRILNRVTSPMMSSYFQSLHERNGVDFRIGCGVSDLLGETSVNSIRLKDGSTLDADLVLVGIGVVPNVELAQDCGLKCENGIVTDEQARTNDEHIYAIGDCASRPLEHYDRQGRLESVHNALEQAKLAAAAITKSTRPKLECPWFWSDQYDKKLQIAGISDGYDDHVVRGSIGDDSFSIFYTKEGVLIAADCINAAPEFMTAKRLIPNKPRIDKTLFANLDSPIKNLLNTAQ